MEWKIIHIDETDSTNRWLKDHGVGSPDRSEARDQENRPHDCALCVFADYQTAGRGCGTNKWESERGKNLLFSLLIHPEGIPAAKQFHISMAISLAICEALGQHIGDLSIKWPNDIYWRNGKIGGILIENRLQGSTIKDCIIGVGLNINQREFHSDAPNPVSLWQICEHETDRDQLLQDILKAFEEIMEIMGSVLLIEAEREIRRTDPMISDPMIKERYMQMLYRRKSFHPYVDKDGAFMAQLVDVEDDGHLLLCDDNGQQRRYAFKEVQYVI